MPERILLIQLRRIGDVLMTTPAVAALREAYPSAHIAYLTEPPSDQLFRHNRAVDEVIALPRRTSPLALLRLMARLRRGRFDLAIDFHGHPRTALLARASGASRRIGLSLRGRTWAYTDSLWPRTEGQTYTALHKAALLAPLGLPVENLSLLPRLPLGGPERDHAAAVLEGLGVGGDDLLVALSPVSRQPYKVWPAEDFAYVADMLIERYGAKVLLVWGPGEEHFANAVRLAMTQTALPDYPMPDLLQLAALLERCALVVSNDNGPRHFAVAVGTPTVTIFGRPRPENWTPPGLPQHQSMAYDPGCKDDCTYPRCGLECLEGVSRNAVMAAVESQMEELLADGTPH